MKYLLTEKQLKRIIESSETSVDAVLVGGLDYRKSDYPIGQQVELLKNGLGSNKNIKGFRYNAPTKDVLDFLSQNPKVPVFLFSAGCSKANELSKSEFVDKNKLFIIEPYAASSNVVNTVSSAVANGVPSTNVFVGGTSGRGMGVVSNPSKSNSSSHFGALTSVGSMLSGMKTPSKPSAQSDVIDTDKPKDVKKFQSWLDKNHPGWHSTLGTLNDDEDKGWGTYGPNTKRAWQKDDWRKEYMKQS